MKRAFLRPRYALLCSVIAVAVFVTIASWPAWDLLNTLMNDTSLDLAQKITMSVRLLSDTIFVLSPYDGLYAGATSLLLSINIVLLLFYLKMFRTASLAGTTSGLFGGALAIIGFGCSACGAVFAISFAQLLGVSGLISTAFFWPDWVGWIGLLICAASIFFLDLAIRRPAVCPV